MIRNISQGDRVAIALSLLPAFIIVGSQFWHAFQTEASADCLYALTGITLMTAIAGAIYLPFMTTKVSYGEEYSVFNAFLWAFAGLSIVMMVYGLSQAHVTGWRNPVVCYEAYVAVGIISLFWLTVVVAFA